MNTDIFALTKRVKGDFICNVVEASRIDNGGNRKARNRVGKNKKPFFMENLQASAVFINILSVIDTEYVKSTYPNPSQDPNNPTSIDHYSEFVLCTGSRGTFDPGTAVLSFTANPGDEVPFRAVSIYDNSDDAVIVYGIAPFGESSNLFNTFVADVVTLQQLQSPIPTRSMVSRPRNRQ